MSAAIRFSGPTADTLRIILKGAHARMTAAKCQSVFSLFQDAGRRPLAQKLEALGHTPQSYLALVLFYDGGQGLACRRRGALFVTSPGSRVVFVCPNGLQKWADTWPDWAEAAVIHEVLHTLGLGENPPSSDEINRAVLDACRP